MSVGLCYKVGRGKVLKSIGARLYICTLICVTDSVSNMAICYLSPPPKEVISVNLKEQEGERVTFSVNESDTLAVRVRGILVPHDSISTFFLLPHH